MKTALVLEGPGFSEQGEVLRNLGFAGFRQVQRFVWDALDDAVAGDAAAADLLLIRGPWSLSPEERLLSKTMAAKLSGLDFSKGPSVLAVGRGALVALELLVGANLVWESRFEDGARWIRLRSSEAEPSHLVGLRLGRAVPKMPATLLDGRPISPWLVDDRGETMAWHVERKIWISPLDILAYAERTQLPDYGYADLTTLLTQADILDRFAKKGGL